MGPAYSIGEDLPWPPPDPSIQSCSTAGMTCGAAAYVLDAHFEHPPELVRALVGRWRLGTKLVATRRSDDAAALPPVMLLAPRLSSRLLEGLGDVRIPQGSADYMLLDRAVVDV